MQDDVFGTELDLQVNGKWGRGGEEGNTTLSSKHFYTA